jgi:hypothetical protein
MLDEMIFCRAVDNFLGFISELLALIFTTKPHTLKSSEVVRVADVLKYSTMDELVWALADRRVTRLSYQGMSELAKDLKDKLGFELFSHEAQLERTVLIVELRNLLIHNRGVVNRIFLSKLSNFPTKLGEKVILKDVFQDIYYLTKLVVEIEKRATEKFGLPRETTRGPIDCPLADNAP